MCLMPDTTDHVEYQIFNIPKFHILMSIIVLMIYRVNYDTAVPSTFFHDIFVKSLLSVRFLPKILVIGNII